VFEHEDELGDSVAQLIFMLKQDKPPQAASLG
jgi:hypothetical protein